MLSTSYFQQFILHHFSMINYISLALASRQYCNVRYPTGFKPAITLGMSNQITSNSVYRYRGPIPIDLYCSLIFSYAIRYGDTVEQTTCTFSRSIRANDIATASPYIERDAICHGTFSFKGARNAISVDYT